MSVAPHPPTKVCTGPSHPGPTRLPLTSEHWYFHGESPWAISAGMVGKPLSRCRLCRAWVRCVDRASPHGLVSARKIERYVRELVERCGTADAVTAQHGISGNTIDRVLNRRIEAVKAKTATRVLLALSEQRKYDRRNGLSERFLAARRAQGRLDERLTRLAGY